MDFRICHICNIRYPIFLGPMLRISKGPLVAAFSKAGGLGCLASSGMSKEEFHKQVASIRKETDSPFAINIPWPTPNSQEIVEWSIHENIGIVVSSAGFSKNGLKRLKSAGCIVFQVVANVAQALKAESLEVDGVIAKGFESGGLNAPDAVALLPLIPQVVDAVTIPVIAAGGICDGRGLTAALALGAEGVLIGTRFLTTNECQVHDNYKNALIQANDTDTVSINLPTVSARFLKNRRVMDLKDSLVGDESLLDIVQEAGLGANPEKELWAAGQGAGLVKERSPVDFVVEGIIRDFTMTVQRLKSMASDICLD